MISISLGATATSTTTDQSDSPTRTCTDRNLQPHTRSTAAAAALKLWDSSRTRTTTRRRTHDVGTPRASAYDDLLESSPRKALLQSLRRSPTPGRHPTPDAAGRRTACDAQSRARARPDTAHQATCQRARRSILVHSACAPMRARSRTHCLPSSHTLALRGRRRIELGLPSSKVPRRRCRLPSASGPTNSQQSPSTPSDVRVRPGSVQRRSKSIRPKGSACVSTCPNQPTTVPPELDSRSERIGQRPLCCVQPPLSDIFSSSAKLVVQIREALLVIEAVT
ncbi:hypothetical protein C8Q80DRAFT_176610 [Daedaleopsis nitida]|nr:hypothetical protein C8Q80DRAFT_176610 [Daedaleopsis nitida]